MTNKYFILSGDGFFKGKLIGMGINVSPTHLMIVPKSSKLGKAIKKEVKKQIKKK
jgi:hypothetical protein